MEPHEKERAARHRAGAPGGGRPRFTQVRCSIVRRGTHGGQAAVLGRAYPLWVHGCRVDASSSWKKGKRAALAPLPFVRALAECVARQYHVVLVGVVWLASKMHEQAKAS